MVALPKINNAFSVSSSSSVHHQNSSSSNQPVNRSNRRLKSGVAIDHHRKGDSQISQETTTDGNVLLFLANPIADDIDDVE